MGQKKGKNHCARSLDKQLITSFIKYEVYLLFSRKMILIYILWFCDYFLWNKRFRSLTCVSGCGCRYLFITG